jgi:hypothetical protein
MSRRLAVVLVATGSFVYASPALAGSASAPRASDFEQALQPHFFRSGAAPRSGVIATRGRFDLVGLKWRSAQRVRAQIRVRSTGGAWSPWTAMVDDAGAGRDTEPVWTGRADALQLRLNRMPRGLRAHFVRVSRAPEAAAARPARLRARARAAARAGVPTIIPRAAWGADACPPRATPSYGEVQVGFVHHTVSANHYGPQDSAAMVLAICRYHRNSNGWNDIGYNFLVDRYGQVFEGRAGGVDQPVIGAQAQGYNAVSTGIANIGTFTSSGQTPAAVQAMAQLLAWKLSLHGVPVTGQVTVTSNGGASNRYPQGKDVTFERISGHRDADATECPGDALYAQLGEIRAQAAALAPQYGGPTSGGLTLDAGDRSLSFGQPAQLSGRLTADGGDGLGGVKVSLQIAGSKGFFTTRSTTTAADGAWSVALATSYSRTLRAVARSASGSLVTSRQLRVGVAPRLRLRSRSHVIARRAFTVKGSARPRVGRITLVLQRNSAGTMRTILRRRVPVRGGRYAVTLRLRESGLHRLRAVFVGDAHNSSARTGYVYVRARHRSRG